MSEWISVAEAARRLGISERQVRYLATKNIIAGQRYGAGHGHISRSWHVVDAVMVADYAARVYRQQVQSALANAAKNRSTPAPCCPECDLLTADGQLCQLCQDKQAGRHYWWRRELAR